MLGVIGKYNFFILLWSNLIGGIILFLIVSCYCGSKIYYFWIVWNFVLYNNIIIYLWNCKKKRFMYLFEVLVL